MILILGRQNTAVPSIPIDTIVGYFNSDFYTLVWYPIGFSVKKIEIFRKFLGTLGEKEIFLLSHSAGGRMSSLIADEPNIERLVCFGYPFKHPDEPEDLSRTVHLKTFPKPFLIFQGSRDIYGRENLHNRYEMSQHIEIRYLDTNHEFIHVSAENWKKIFTEISDFFANREVI